MLKLLEILETPDLLRVTRMVEDYLGSREGLHGTYMLDFIQNDKVHIVITNETQFLEEDGYRIKVFTFDEEKEADPYSAEKAKEMTDKYLRVRGKPIIKVYVDWEHTPKGPHGIKESTATLVVELLRTDGRVHHQRTWKLVPNDSIVNKDHFRKVYEEARQHLSRHDATNHQIGAVKRQMTLEGFGFALVKGT